MGLIKSFGKFSGTIHQKLLYCSVYQTLKNIPGYLNDIFAALFGFTYVRNYIWKGGGKDGKGDVSTGTGKGEGKDGKGDVSKGTGKGKDEEELVQTPARRHVTFTDSPQGWVVG